MNIAGIESIELLLSENRSAFTYISSPESAVFEMIKKNIPIERLMVFREGKAANLTDDKAVISEAFNREMKQRRIGGYFPISRSSAKLEKWGKAMDINILSTSWNMQKKLENKIFFDRFLKQNGISSPQSWVLESKNDIRSIHTASVLQAPFQMGSHKTYYCQTQQEVERIITEKKLSFPLLCREYVKGFSISVNVLMGAKEMIFSSLVTQVVSFDKDGHVHFYGVQWMDPAKYPEKMIHAFETAVKLIADQFQSLGARGLINFDCIASEDIYFLECNPRMTLTCAQGARNKSLYHNHDFVTEFIKAVTEQKLSANKPHFAKSDYRGCAVPLKLLKSEMSLKKLGAKLPVGVYELQGATLRYYSDNIEDFEGADRILIWHNLPGDFGSCFINQPFFDLGVAGECEFNEKGKIFHRAILEFIRQGD